MTEDTLLSRFLRYVQIDTQSSESSGTHPSSPGQLVLAKMLVAELSAMGAEKVRLSDEGYVYATIPATPGRENENSLGFLAHMDTSPDASGTNIKPSVVTYRGGVLPLGKSGRALDPKLFPFLHELAGKTFVVTDGTTLLGADDKAGVAILMTLAERLLAKGAPSHGEVHIAFTPDEEICEGTAGFDPARFCAKRAYTFDGGDLREVENANFNAAFAVFHVQGVSTHPGAAKGVMINAIRVAAKIVESLAPGDSPEQTEGRQGFYHPVDISGTSAKAEVSLLIREHDANKFEARKYKMGCIARSMNDLYGPGTVSVDVRDQYRNMEDVLVKYPELTEAACDAIRRQGVEPRIVAVRGGTDGANLSYMGIPCPNLGTGGRNFHGEMEFAVVEEMEAALAVGLALACGTKARG